MSDIIRLKEKGVKSCKPPLEEITDKNGVTWCHNCKKGVNFNTKPPKCYKRRVSTAKPTEENPTKPLEEKPAKKMGKVIKFAKGAKQVIKEAKQAEVKGGIKDPDYSRVKRWGLSAKFWIFQKTYLSENAYADLVKLLYDQPEYLLLGREEIFGKVGKLIIPRNYEKKYPDLAVEMGRTPKEATIQKCGLSYDNTGALKQPRKEIDRLEKIGELENRKKGVINRIYEIAEILGINKNVIKNITFNPRITRRLGQYRKFIDGAVYLDFHTAFLVIDPEDKSQENEICVKWWEETLSHELVHIIRSNHNPAFKACLEGVMHKLGYRDYSCEKGPCANVDLFEW